MDKDLALRVLLTVLPHDLQHLMEALVPLLAVVLVVLVRRSVVFPCQFLVMRHKLRRLTLFPYQ